MLQLSKSNIFRDKSFDFLGKFFNGGVGVGGVGIVVLSRLFRSEKNAKFPCQNTEKNMVLSVLLWCKKTLSFPVKIL